MSEWPIGHRINQLCCCCFLQVVLCHDDNITVHALRAGKTTLHFHYTDNYSNDSEPIVQ